MTTILFLNSILFTYLFIDLLVQILLHLFIYLFIYLFTCSFIVTFIFLRFPPPHYKYIGLHNNRLTTLPDFPMHRQFSTCQLSR